MLDAFILAEGRMYLQLQLLDASLCSVSEATNGAMKAWFNEEGLPLDSFLFAFVADATPR